MHACMSVWYEYVYMFLLMRVHSCLHVCGGQRSVINVRYLPQSLMDFLYYLVSEFQESSCLDIPSARFERVCQRFPFFLWVLVIKLKYAPDVCLARTLPTGSFLQSIKIVMWSDSFLHVLLSRNNNTNYAIYRSCSLVPEVLCLQCIYEMIWYYSRQVESFSGCK